MKTLLFVIQHLLNIAQSIDLGDQNKAVEVDRMNKAQPRIAVLATVFAIHPYSV